MATEEAYATFEEAERGEAALYAVLPGSFDAGFPRKHFLDRRFAFADQVPGRDSATLNSAYALQLALEYIDYCEKHSLVKNDVGSYQRFENEVDRSDTDRPPPRNSWSRIIQRNGTLYCMEVYIYDVMNNEGNVAKVSYEVRYSLLALERYKLLLNSMTTGVQLHYLHTEEVALKKLRELIEPAEYAGYMLTGILEFEGCSGLLYLIRKGRPTLALRKSMEGGSEYHSPIATLCMHPLGYMPGTWSGILPPTDEVIAHLLLLRSGEHEYWKRCNQHSPDGLLSGL